MHRSRQGGGRDSQEGRDGVFGAEPESGLVFPNPAPMEGGWVGAPLAGTGLSAGRGGALLRRDQEAGKSLPSLGNPSLGLDFAPARKL